MAAPSLNDYEYQFKDSGFLLNSDVVLPFIDVDKVQGLDLPTIEPNIDDIDGQHGSSVYVKFTKERTIIIDGTLYADPSSIETTIDTLIGNYLPNGTEYPFYFKHPGVNQRYVLAQPIACKIDVDTLRRTGRSAVQLQVVAADPRKYIDNANAALVSNTSVTPSNPGNANSYPILTIVGAYSSINFRNNATARSVVFTYAATAGMTTVIDMKKKIVTVNGTNLSRYLTTTDWWDIPAGGGQSVKYTYTGTAPTSVTLSTRQAWM